MRQERSQQQPESTAKPKQDRPDDPPQDEMSDDDLDAVSGGNNPPRGKPGCIYPPAD